MEVNFDHVICWYSNHSVECVYWDVVMM